MKTPYSKLCVLTFFVKIFWQQRRGLVTKIELPLGNKKKVCDNFECSPFVRANNGSLHRVGKIVSRINNKNEKNSWRIKILSLLDNGSNFTPGILYTTVAGTWVQVLLGAYFIPLSNSPYDVSRPRITVFTSLHDLLTHPKHKIPDSPVWHSHTTKKWYSHMTVLFGLSLAPVPFTRWIFLKLDKLFIKH